MAAGKKDAQPSKGETPPEGCVFMWRKDEAGAVQRAEVESLCGSVEIMQAQGWSLEPAKE